MVWHGLTGGSAPASVDETAAADLASLAQERGEIAAELDPAFVRIALMSLVMAPVTLPRPVLGSTGKNQAHLNSTNTSANNCAPSCSASPRFGARLRDELDVRCGHPRVCLIEVPEHEPAAALGDIGSSVRPSPRHVQVVLRNLADPALVAGWTQQVQRERQATAAQLATLEAGQRGNHPMTRKEIHQLVASLGGLVHILKAADPTDKLDVYRQLGLKLTYDHEKRVVVAETAPQPPVCVVSVSGGGYMR